jgi:hypothetical protein
MCKIDQIVTSRLFFVKAHDTEKRKYKIPELVAGAGFEPATFGL